MLSKKSQSLQRRLTHLIKREIEKGMDEEEIIGALEIVKCNVAIAAAHVNVSLAKSKTTKNSQN